MRISNFLSEAIINPPSNLRHFVTSRMRKLSALKDQLGNCHQTIEQEGVSDRLVQHIGQSLNCYTDGIEHEIKRKAGGAYSDPLGDLIHSLRSYADHGPTFLRYVINAADQFNIPDEPLDEASRLSGFRDALLSYGYAPNDPDEEYQSCLRRFIAMESGMRALIKANSIIDQISEKLSVVTKRADAVAMGNAWRPEHADTEILYHATAYATEIEREGFSAEKPIERRGLGLYGQQNAISVTHSLNVAVQISRCLKELCMIAHGQLTRQHIVSWLEREGIMHNIDRLDQIPHTIEGTASLYNQYLWFTKVRQNPVFTHIDKIVVLMKTRSLDDVGVIACTVNMTGEEEYKGAESEFIITPDQVTAVKRMPY